MNYLFRLCGNLMAVLAFSVAMLMAAIGGNVLATFIAVFGILLALLGVYEVHIHDSHVEILREQLDLANRRCDQARVEAHRLREHKIERYL